MRKELYIIRHGETEYNRNGIIQGRGVDSSLNETGRKQAKAFFEKFKHHPFEKLYTSTLKRTQETVRHFIEMGLKWEPRPELDEIDWGEHEGKNTDHLLKQEYSKVLSSWKSNELHICTPGGESPLELQARQRQFIEYLYEQPEQLVLICTHGRAMRSLLCTLTEYELCNMDQFPHHNLSLYKVLMDTESCAIDIFNNRDHLHG